MPTAMIETKALRSGHKGARTLLLGLATALCGAAATPSAAEMTPSAAAPKRFVIDLTLKLSADSLKLTSMRAAAPSTLAPATVPPLTTLAAPISRYDDPTPSRSSASPSILGGLKTIANGGAWPTETTQAGQDAGLIDRSPAAPPIPFSEFTREIAIKAQAAGGVAAELYAARNHTPIWLRPTRYGRVRAEAAAVVASTLINADRHGAPLERYDATALMEAASRAEAVRDWEVSPKSWPRLSCASPPPYSHMLATWARGWWPLAGSIPRLTANAPAIALKDRFTAVAEASDRSMVPSDQRVAAANGVWDVALTLDGSSVSEALEALAPNSPDYRALMAQLEIARARADALDNAPLVKVKGRVETGDADPSVPAVRRRLALLGHLPPSANQASELYDAALAEAVHKFQALNGLQVDV